MKIRNNISLKAYNTFGVDSKARYFIEVNSEKELIEALKLEGFPEKIVLGGGSNILLTKDIDALVLHIHLKGKKIITRKAQTTVIDVMAGENWHELVLWTLKHNLGGLENLSLIPGNAGTAPIQNIGAYGTEIKDVFVSCDAIEIKTQKKRTFTKKQCEFGYRTSVFKTALKGKYIITSIRLQLTHENHSLNTSYGAIEQALQEKNITSPSIHDVSEAVISIRQSKLPDPKILGNSGSFFKNPIISVEEFSKLQNHYPEIPFYKVNNKEVKIPAGWLIERCGFKGKRFGDTGVHEKQALVLVNYGNAPGKDILALAKKIKKQVKDTFGIQIDPEVNIL